MERQASLQTSIFGGFNKKSVLKYIDELCAQNKEATEMLDKKIAGLEEKNKTLEEAFARQSDALGAFEKQETLHAQETESMRRTLEERDLELRRRQEATEEKERECRAQQEKCRQLTLRAEALEYKGKKYDEVVAQVAGAFLEARLSAAEIIKAAEQKANRLTATTMESIQSLTGQIDAFKGDVISLRATLQASMAELQQRIDVIDSSIDTLDAAVRAAELCEKPVEEVPVEPEAEETGSIPAEEEADPAEQPNDEPKPRGDGFFW